MRRSLVLLGIAAVAFAAASISAPSAGAAYGKTAQYQAALSLNCDAKTNPFCTEMVGLGGEWDWYAFNADGTFDSTQTFCAHNDPTFGSGAFHFNGDGNWQAGEPGLTAPPFGQSQDFWVNFNDGQGWQDSGVPYAAGVSMHYSFKPAPGISAVAQVSAIPNR
jgi:hypothetical protein